MRNLKKILALVLALVMTFSVMSVSSAAFKDEADITDVYAESAEVLANLGVFKGYEDGSFNPKGSITRAEVAAIIYRVATGDVSDKQVGIYADYNVFSDVKSTSWYAGYVNYCANAQYIKGYGNGKFGPNDTVTGYQALAMILRAVGYDKNGEFTGPSWQVETAKIGNQLNITRNVNAGTLGTAATREVVAEVLFRAINVPTVTYSLGLGYSQYVNALTTREFNPSLGQMNFRLVQVKGNVEAAVPAYAQIGNTIVVNHDLTWENIGYGAYVWAVPNTGNTTKEYKAVSSAVIYGESLLVNTDNLTYKYLTDNYVTVENDAVVYYNGEMQTTVAAVAATLAKVGEVGVKVDFIDNDFGGIAEAVVVTEYTVDAVSGIANDKNTGTNAIVKDTYYFSNSTSVKAAKLVCADELAVGDYVTYVDYRTYRYADKVDFAMGEFTKINYVKQYEDDTYVIGGVEYLQAEDFIGVQTYLGRDYIGKDLIVGTDPYGYMLIVTPYVPADNYLYVVRTNHTDNVAGTTYATVAFADGTVQNVYIKNSTQTFERYEGHMYTFTEKDGVYTLTQVDCAAADLMFHYTNVDFINYKNSQTNMAGKFLTKSTVVVDLRNVMLRKGDAKVYTGYSEIPSFVDGEVSFVTDRNGFIVLAFLTDGVNYGELEKEFILYTTNYSSYYIDENGVKMFEMNAIVDGEQAKVTLNNDQYAYVQAHGVGYYGFTYGYNYGNVEWEMTYESFMEDWYDVKWQNGTIVLEDYFGTGSDYSYAYNDDVKFWTFDIAKGKAYNYLPTVGTDLVNAHAYVIRNEDNYRLIDEIYIVYGEIAPIADLPTWIYGDLFYYAQNGYVTRVVVNVLVDADLENVLADIEKAQNYAAEAQEILDNEDVIELAAVAAEGKSKADIVAANKATYNTMIDYALALLEAATEDLLAAVEKLEDLVESGKLNESEIQTAVNAIEAVEETAEALEETIEAVVKSDAYALNKLKSAQIDAVKAELVAQVKATEGADNAYVVGTDVLVSEADDAYILTNDATIVVGGVNTSIVAMLAQWSATIVAATDKAGIQLAVTVDEVKAVAAAFVKLCASIVK